MTIAHPRTTHEDDTIRIREDAAAHPERTYREHVEAAERIASESYCEEIRALVRAGRL